MRTFKTIFFKDEVYANRFKELKYDTITVVMPIGYNEYKWYGKNNLEREQITHRATIRVSKEEMEEIAKAIGLKKKRWNGKTCYLYE